MSRKIFPMLVAVLLSVVSMVSAESSKWFVVKGSNNVCRVISAADKTPKTIGGPFDTKEAAQKAKLELCPESATKAEKKKKAEKDKSLATKTGEWAQDTFFKAIKSAFNTAIRKIVDNMF